MGLMEAETIIYNNIVYHLCAKQQGVWRQFKNQQLDLQNSKSMYTQSQMSQFKRFF